MYIYMYMDIDAKRNAKLQVFGLNAHRNRTRIRSSFFAQQQAQKTKRIIGL